MACEANRLIPPNVFYFEQDGLVAKYAVLSEADFARVAGASGSVSVWARFAQPSRLVWAADEAAHEQVIEAVAKPRRPCLRRRGRVRGEEPLALWRRAFALTYSAELRAERKGRASSVVDLDPERYREFAKRPGDRWSTPRVRARQRAGGGGSEGEGTVRARLAKASLTFAGGADYIAWKINRHAGADIQLKPWQRRHPLLAGLSLLPRLLRSGAVR